MQIIQQPAALADHHQQSATGAMIFDVLLQMVGQMVDPLGQKSNLHVCGAGVLLVKLEITYRLRLRIHT